MGIHWFEFHFGAIFRESREGIKKSKTSHQRTFIKAPYFRSTDDSVRKAKIDLKSQYLPFLKATNTWIVSNFLILKNISDFLAIFLINIFYSFDKLILK